uniref:Kinesin motor domain-containing protein n=1 Tax=Phaeomonas parva TaxID=124430 RepID=A0A6U4FVQ6_9STRA|mmetsp:Transcript_26720/g.83713  ORF Transcript_26720/g.83713 Transcript_26720/m.83713 type:complete len:206 (+) Transcript_26720:113-730(+)
MSAGPGSPGRASPERGNVRVVCRVRPQNQIEVDRGGTPCVSLSDTSIQIVTEDGDTSFTFDHVFGQDSKQREVFDYVAAPTVADVMSGYNATIFAYGQTGSGKTFTMEGADIDDGELRGVIPRTADALFQAIADADASIEFVVKVSYVEIYCEKIRDLLDEYRTKVNLPIREDRQKGVYISGVTEEYITGPGASPKSKLEPEPKP